MAFIFKHELTHFAETAGESFTLFMNEVMDSQAFKDWVKSKGYADSDTVSATMAMNAEYIKRWKFNGKDAEHKANLEMVADFVGENLFAKDLTRLEQAIKQMQPKTVKTFKEWILNILDKLKAALQSIGKHTEIETLERDFVRICDEAMKNAEQKQAEGEKGQKENSTEGGVEYSLSDNFYQNYIENLSEKEYNYLTTKKPIRVVKDVFAAVVSVRTELYGDAKAEDIPIIDIINLAEYGILDTDDFYFIRNADRTNFSIIKHTKTLKGRNSKYVDIRGRQKGNQTTRGNNNENGRVGIEGEDNPSNRNNRPSSDKSAFRKNANKTQFVEKANRRTGVGNGINDIGRRGRQLEIILENNPGIVITSLG